MQLVIIAIAIYDILICRYGWSGMGIVLMGIGSNFTGIAGFDGCKNG